MNMMKNILTIVGSLLCIIGAGVLLFGWIDKSIHLQLSGITMYTCSLPLLFARTMTEMKKRVKHLEDIIQSFSKNIPSEPK